MVYSTTMSWHNNARLFISHRFFRANAIFQLGSVGAMLVQAVAGVVLARVLGPHEFGRFAIVMSMAAVGSVFLGTGAADALAPVLTRAHHQGDDAAVREALLFLGKFMLGTSLLVALLGFAMPSIARYLYGDQLLGWLGFMVLMASAVSTIALVPTQLGLQISGHIGSLSMLTFSDQTVRQAFVVALAMTGFGITGAASGHLLGAVVVFVLALLFWSGLRRSWSALPTFAAVWSHAPLNGRPFIAPTLWVLIDRNLAMLYGAAPIATAGLFLTTSDVSYFKIALGWVTLALSVLSPVSTLLNTELARIQVQQPHLLRLRFLQITGGAVGASTLVSAVAALIARPMFSLLYGAQYVAAVPLVYGLVPFGALFGLGVALGPMWRAMNQVRRSILINLCVLTAGIPLALLGLQHWGAIGAVAMVTVWYTASHSISFWYLLRVLGKMQSI